MFYRIVYCSRNRIQGTREEIDAEIQSILAVSRLNNEASGVTGALLFNGEAFAQVLEGPRDVVDLAFAKIRFDPRHDHVVLLEQAHQPERHFVSWLMAYSDARSLHTLFDHDAVYANPDKFAGRILNLLRGVVAAHLGN